jgi:hypothetical protein
MSYVFVLLRRSSTVRRPDCRSDAQITTVTRRDMNNSAYLDSRQLSSHPLIAKSDHPFLFVCQLYSYVKPSYIDLPEPNLLSCFLTSHLFPSPHCVTPDVCTRQKSRLLGGPTRTARGPCPERRLIFALLVSAHRQR